MDSQLSLYVCQGVKRNRLQCTNQVKAVHPWFAYCSHHSDQNEMGKFAKLSEREVEVIVLLRQRDLIGEAHEWLMEEPNTPDMSESEDDDSIVDLSERFQLACVSRSRSV
jgi:hypothetical protein